MDDPRYKAGVELLRDEDGWVGHIVEGLLALINELDEQIYSYWELSMGEDL